MILDDYTSSFVQTLYRGIGFCDCLNDVHNILFSNLLLLIKGLACFLAG